MIDDFKFGLKVKFLGKFLENESRFSQNSPQHRILKTSGRHKNSEKGPTFSSKILESVDVKTINWHIPVQKYRKEFQRPGKVLKLINNMI